MTVAARACASWLAWSAAAVGVVLAVGGWPALRAGGAGSLAALAVGCGVAWLAALAGALPVVVALARRAAGPAHRVVGWSMALRAGGTLAGVLALALGSPLPRTPALAGLGLGYGALLLVETRWTVRWLAGAR